MRKIICLAVLFFCSQTAYGQCGGSCFYGNGGGLGNNFTTFTGPTTTLKTFTLPDASATILTTNAAVTVGQGGTGLTVGVSGGIPYYSSTTAMTSSALLAQYALLVGGGATAAPYSLSSLGTTTTVLHGNASGNPSFGAVNLATDVTGVLPAANVLPACDPLNMTSVCFNEEFPNSNITSLGIGALGWTLAQIVGTTSSVAQLASIAAWPHVGVETLTTQAVAGDGLWITLNNAHAYGGIGLLGANAGWDSYFEFQLGSGTSTAAIYRVGYASQSSAINPIVPSAGGAYLRLDPTLTNVVSATYTSGGTVTGSAAQTCNAAFVGGTATAIITLTGTNSIAGGLFTSVFGGAGYNPATSPVAAVLTNGSATCAGTATVVVTEGAPGTGADTTFHLCAKANSGTAEYCYATGAGADVNWHNLEISSGVAGTISMSLDHAAAITLCGTGCTVNMSPYAVDSGDGWNPGFEVLSNTGTTSESLNADFWRFKATVTSF